MSTMTLHTSAIDRLCKRNVELSAFSTYGIGGSANYLAMPETANDLADLLRDCRKRGMPWYIFGMGSIFCFRMNRNMTWCLYRSKPGGGVGR